jgi:hypothetical protein
MSSKKQLRKKRQERRAAERQRRSGLNPATLFILATVAIVVIIGIVASLRGPDAGSPPRPGAVWSEAHGHWH